MTGFRLETERLVLRDWQGDADWEAFFRHTNNPRVMRWLGPLINAAGQADMRQRIEACAAANGHCFWLVERKPDGGHLSGEVLGFCGLKRADAPASTIPGRFEAGWRMREEAWGHGYAKEAATASLEAGFARFGAEEIFALTVAGNTASWGLMTRLGMRRREELDYPDDRYAGELCDTIVYSISRDAWGGAQ
ncbi:MAG TPA: GNAT family N-acetyltransferase [Croceibacterium sp.]|nr:GNAT family N-acetyltransferase [Croceibacterium sp.]